MSSKRILSSKIIGLSPKDSAVPSEKLEKSTGYLDYIEAPKDSVLKIMDMEQELYAKVVMISQKDLDD